MATDPRLAAAARFLRSAAEGPPPADLPVEIAPQSVAEAYAIQHLTIGADGVAGWKVGATSAPGAYSCAALSSGRLLADGGILQRGNRLPEVEVEIAIRIARDLLPGGARAREEVLAALGSAHAAFEIVESRFLDRKKAAPLSTLADAQSCRAFVIAEQGVEGWQDRDLAGVEAVLSVDGAELARKTGSASASQIVEAIHWLAGHADRFGGLRAGQVVITGARIGPLPIGSASNLRAEITGIGAVGLTVV